MTHEVAVDILGAKYVIKSKAEPEYTKKLALFLDKKMKEVTEKSKVISTTKIAVLASLNIADELFRLRGEEGGKSDGEVAEKIQKLVHLIDDSKALQ